MSRSGSILYGPVLPSEFPSPRPSPDGRGRSKRLSLPNSCRTGITDRLATVLHLPPEKAGARTPANDISRFEPMNLDRGRSPGQPNFLRLRLLLPLPPGEGRGEGSFFSLPINEVHGEGSFGDASFKK
jgi:hypothetical protein